MNPWAAGILIFMLGYIAATLNGIHSTLREIRWDLKKLQ